MDGSDYFLEVLIRDRLAAARAEAARRALAATVQPPRRRVLAVVTRALMGLALTLRTRR